MLPAKYLFTLIAIAVSCLSTSSLSAITDNTKSSTNQNPSNQPTSEARKQMATIHSQMASSTWAAPKTAPHTVRNLEAAIQGEANAANEYQLFSHKAEQEGFDQVAKLFRAASQAESLHRENHQMALLALGGPSVKIKLNPVKVASTKENLEAPIKGEAKEQATMYPRFIRDAEKEDVPQAVRTFTFARDTEAEHERLFKRALAQLGKNPPEDYYVSKISGYTVAIPSGHTFAKASTGEYFRVS